MRVNTLKGFASAALLLVAGGILPAAAESRADYLAGRDYRAKAAVQTAHNNKFCGELNGNRVAGIATSDVHSHADGSPFPGRDVIIAVENNIGNVTAYAQVPKILGDGWVSNGHETVLNYPTQSTLKEEALRPGLAGKAARNVEAAIVGCGFGSKK
jgi:hypothetical protein